MPEFLEKMLDSEKAILGGSIVVLVALFLPWYGWDFNVGAGVLGTLSNSGSFTGFHSWGLLTFIALLFVIAVWLVRGPLSDQVKLPEMSITDAQLYMIGGGVEVLGSILYWLTVKGDNIDLPGYSAGVRFGVFVALVGGIITIVGGYLKQSEPVAAATTSIPPPPPATYGAPPPPATPPPGTPV
jgi:hypothetical protein